MRSVPFSHQCLTMCGPYFGMMHRLDLGLSKGDIQLYTHMVTNRSAIIIVILLAGFAVFDGINGWSASVFLGKKFLLLMETIAIWR